jgi:FAD:protein FMN transferase
MEKISFEAIGTFWSIEAERLSFEVQHRIAERINVFDKDYSRFRSDSLVSRMAKEAGTYTLPGDARPMLDLYRSVYDLTAGLVTPLIGQVLSDAGYDAEYSLKRGALTPPPSWDDTLEYAFPELIVKEPALLDFGAAGKGYLVDIIGGILRENECGPFVIDAGGDILVSHGSERIALEHPDLNGEAIGVVTLENGSLCGSAGNRRAWAGFTHIIHPKDLVSPTRKAVWVTAETTLLADMMATCLFFVSPETLLKTYCFEYLIVEANLTSCHSAGFPAELF